MGLPGAEERALCTIRQEGPPGHRGVPLPSRAQVCASRQRPESPGRPDSAVPSPTVETSAARRSPRRCETPLAVLPTYSAARCMPSAGAAEPDSELLSRYPHPSNASSDHRDLACEQHTDDTQLETTKVR